MDTIKGNNIVSVGCFSYWVSTSRSTFDQCPLYIALYKTVPGDCIRLVEL